jgi:hypothetical protein
VAHGREPKDEGTGGFETKSELRREEGGFETSSELRRDHPQPSAPPTTSVRLGAWRAWLVVLAVVVIVGVVIYVVVSVL